MFVQTTPMIFKERNMIHKRSNTFRVEKFGDSMIHFS